jgi:SHS2 domain-containing protein
MPYRYLEDIATADAAFEAWGEDLVELFKAAADATMNVMVADLETIEKREEVTFDVEHEALDLLLFNFLQELIFFKDARRLLLRMHALAIEKRDSCFFLRASAFGEVVNPDTHNLVVDVKAVTLYRFALHQIEGGWKATVVLDI